MQGLRAHRAALGFERLETRDCPAILSHGSALVIMGTHGDDTLDITDDGTGSITVTLNGTTKTVTGITSVNVLAGAGNDTITYTLTGDETGKRNVVIHAGQGDDTVTLNAGNITGQFQFQVHGGFGADTISATVGGVAAGATAAIYLSGSQGADTITADAAGEYDGLLDLRLKGEGGADTVTGTVDVAAGSTGRVIAAARGGIGDDTLSLDVTGDGLPELTSLFAVIRGEPGTDTGSGTDNVTKYSIELEPVAPPTTDPAPMT